MGTRAVMMSSRKAKTAILIVVGGNMLETDWGVEQGWEGERALRIPKKLQLVASEAPSQGAVAVARKEEV